MKNFAVSLRDLKENMAASIRGDGRVLRPTFLADEINVAARMNVDLSLRIGGLSLLKAELFAVC